MYRHLKLRMYPNNFQKVMIDKSFGYTYSHYLVEKKYENDSTITEEKKMSIVLHLKIILLILVILVLMYLRNMCFFLILVG